MKNNIKYLPFLSGNYSTAPGLKALSSADYAFDQKLFQIDELYQPYLINKTECREENLEKYYLESNLHEKTAQVINHFISERLAQDYPEKFNLNDDFLANHLTGRKIHLNESLSSKNEPYVSLFDALCNQVQEDMAIFQLTDDSDYLAAIHLCAPNHWSPADKIGKPFDAIHQPVAEMEKTIKNYRIMFDSIVQKRGPFTRFAWGLGTDNRLNHHPDPPINTEKSQWSGRSYSNKKDELFLRVERQNLIGFPEVKAFLFTIRTYHYRVDELTPYEKLKLKEAIDSMTDATKKYKGIDLMMPLIERVLA